MREAIGGTWLFGLVITFIVFFASFLAVSINYSKAFNVKNNIVDIISRYEGNNCNSRKQIVEYLRDVGYLVSGKCSEKDTNGDGMNDNIGYNLNGEHVSSNKAYYCISSASTMSATSIEKKYYQVEIFFKIDLPIIGDLTSFRINGETEYIFFATDENEYEC